MDADADPVKLRVLRGEPTAEELAAVVTAILVRTRSGPAAGAAGHRARPGSTWVRSARPGAVTAGLPTDRGPHAWRGSALPR